MITWGEAVARSWTLVLLASHGGAHEFDEASARVHIQHGLGAGKRVGAQNYTYGPGWVLRDGRCIYSYMLESSDAGMLRAFSICPELHGRVVVAGDLALDALLVRSRFRSAIRAQYGISRGSTAILVVSTWGPTSNLAVFGADLIRRLAQYPGSRILFATHPLNWHASGPQPSIAQKVLEQTSPIITAFCGPQDEWFDLVVASDVVICDHSSLALYCAFLGRPLVFLDAPHQSVDPSSVLAHLRDACSRSAGLPDLHDAINDARRRPPLPLSLRNEICDVPGQAASRTMALYEATLGDQG